MTAASGPLQLIRIAWYLNPRLVSTCQCLRVTRVDG